MKINDYFISVDEKTPLPTVGKYSSKNKTFFNDIKEYQDNTEIGKYNIRPIQFTFEITNKCNCNCLNCGMSANSIKSGKTALTETELYNLVDDLKTNGIISYAVTGGEPFLKFEDICKMITYANNKVDIIKLISNGFWGNNPKYYFDKLVDSGFLNNKFVVPSIYISIGEQNVPLKDICNLLNYVNKTFEKDAFNFGIINTKHLEDEHSQLEKLFILYNNLYGDFPEDRFYLTESIYVNSNKLSINKIETIKDNAYTCIRLCDNKFEQTLGKFVSPKIFMKCNGDCYPCEVFNYHKYVYLGNYFENGLDKIIYNYNHNNFILFIKKYGTVGFRDVMPKDILNENYFETACQTCEFCIKYCAENNLIRM